MRGSKLASLMFMDPLQDVPVGNTSERTGMSPGMLKYGLPTLLALAGGAGLAAVLARKSAAPLADDALNQMLRQIGAETRYAGTVEAAAYPFGTPSAPSSQQLGTLGALGPAPTLQNIFTAANLPHVPTPPKSPPPPGVPFIERLKMMLGITDPAKSKPSYSPHAGTGATPAIHARPLYGDPRTPEQIKERLARYLEEGRARGVDPSVQTDIIDDRTRNELWLPNTLTPLVQKLNPMAMGGAVGAIQHPTPNTLLYSHVPAAADKGVHLRRYLRTRDIPMWDVDLPAPAHAPEQVRATSLGEALESFLHAGVGSGTVYRTPGGIRLADTGVRATPIAIEHVGGVPQRTDPWYSNLIQWPGSMDFVAPEKLEQDLWRYFGAAGADPLRGNKQAMLAAIYKALEEGAFDNDALRTLMLPMRPGYSARLTPKRGRTDYVAQPIIEFTRSPAIPSSRDIIKRYHDIPLARFLQREPQREQFAKDVAADLKSVDRVTQAKIREYINKKHGIALSLAALLGLPAAAQQQGE